MDNKQVKKISNMPTGTRIQVGKSLLIKTDKTFDSGHPVWEDITPKPPSKPKRMYSPKPKLRPFTTEKQHKAEFEKAKLKLQAKAWKEYQRKARQIASSSDG
jgi:hypothetical protein